MNLTRLRPGAASALHHVHSRQDELIYVLEGEPTLFTDAGPLRLRPGMVAGFPAGGAAHLRLSESGFRVNLSGEPRASWTGTANVVLGAASCQLQSGVDLAHFDDTGDISFGIGRWEALEGDFHLTAAAVPTRPLPFRPPLQRHTGHSRRLLRRLQQPHRRDWPPSITDQFRLGTTGQSTVRRSL